MSGTPDQDDIASKRQALASASGRDLDPLAAHESTFKEAGLEQWDPFEMFLKDVIAPRNIEANSKAHYEVAFRQWCEHMEDAGRHPACPNEEHVRAFARWRLDEHGNHPNTVKEKLRKLDNVYEYWQSEAAFPHPTDYNPFAAARKKVTFEPPEEKEYPRITMEELRERVQGVTHLRERAIIVPQLKLGLRASELCNIKLSEVSIENAEVRRHYEELGTHPMLEGRENAVYILHDREGNKSKRPRVLPLDEETRRVLVRWLLIRPDNGESWVLLSADHHEQMGNQGVLDAWKRHFHPDYAETARHKAVGSHYGRHFFTTYWRVDQDANEELVKYLRGDVASRSLDGPGGAILSYVHAYYEDIEELYRKNIFRLKN